jgi:maleylpyruvate isomerase
MERVLYTYFRSSASYRVRIALNLKGLSARYVPIHLTRGGGEQFTRDFGALNPLALVPVLNEGDVRLTQSLAILEYLDERYPSPPLLPASIEDRARVRQLALTVVCEIHPLNNLRVLKYLTGTLGLTEEAKVAWIQHWIKLGFEAFEVELGTSKSRGRFCFGDSPTIADCCLVPQLFNAQRFNVDLSAFPMLLAIHRGCEALPAFQAAHPSRQSDFE